MHGQVAEGTQQHLEPCLPGPKRGQTWLEPGPTLAEPRPVTPVALPGTLNGSTSASAHRDHGAGPPHCPASPTAYCPPAQKPRWTSSPSEA